MALKRIESVAETKPISSKADRPTAVVAGDSVQRFNIATQAKKDAEAKLEDVRENLLDQSVGLFYGYNVQHPNATVKTIEIVDATGSSIRLTSQDKYSKANPDAVESLFAALGKGRKDVDVNDFVQETVVGSFDSNIFLDKEGRFDQSIYDSYAEAIKRVTELLILKGTIAQGTNSPLGTAKKVVPLDGFDAKRYSKFKSVEDQKLIRTVLPNTITMTPMETTAVVPKVEVVAVPKPDAVPADVKPAKKAR
jgi:hypothetical protein